MKRVDYYHFYDDIYCVSLNVRIGGTYEQSMDYLVDDLGVDRKHTDIAGGQEGFHFRILPDWTSKPELRCSVIWLEKPDLAVLVHELVHLVTTSFVDRGVLLSVEDEHYAYYLGWWFKTITEAMKKQNKSKAKAETVLELRRPV